MKTRRRMRLWVNLAKLQAWGAVSFLAPYEIYQRLKNRHEQRTR